jgi:hypothetical protein
MNRNALYWLISLAIAVAIDLPISLNRTHHVSHKEGVHVFAAVVMIIVLTLVIRALIFGVCRLASRPERSPLRSSQRTAD